MLAGGEGAAVMSALSKDPTSCAQPSAAEKKKAGHSFSFVAGGNPCFPRRRQHWGASNAGCGQASVNDSVGDGHAV